MKKRYLKPRWHNWYLTIFYALGFGSWFWLGTAFMGWYLNDINLLNFARIGCLIYLLLCLGIYVFTEFFELIWKRICK